MFAVKDRATSLSYESKTSTFKTSATKSIAMLKEIAGKDLTALNERQLNFLNGFVAGTVVGITPTDADHINPTFAFCKSLGMRAKRVHASIGDGCYRSLQQFSDNKHVQQTLEAKGKLVTWIGPAARPRQATSNDCPYFQIAKKPFACPFTQTNSSEAHGIYEVCKSDPAHP